MAERGRKPKKNKKIREAIYVDPDLLEWINEKAEEKGYTNSEFICAILDKAKEQEGNREQ